MIIIGSTAARYRWPDFPRDPKDLDTFSPLRKDPENFWHIDLTQWYLERSKEEDWYATEDELYTIKVSHSYWVLDNGSWDKHIFDLMWMKKHGAKLIPEFHSLLYNIWNEVHGPKRVNLNMDSEDFFNDVVVRKYDHDSIHDSVAYGSHARYIDVLKDGESVAMDMSKIWSLPFEAQVELYREEIAATALERVIIPNDYQISPGFAWKFALKKTITSLTKGWSARFIVDNLDYFIRPDDYVIRHKNNMDKLIPIRE